ncbi:MAG: HAMP domain-containing sensor histidine kinase [Sedimenticola sp.]
MRSALLSGMNPNRLRLSLLLFFLALLIPTVVLIMQAYSQLKWEAFHHHQVEAESLAGRINEHLSRLIEREERRPFADFHFLVVEGDSSSNFLQRSPLSAYPVDSEIPGLIGFFQVDSVGRFSTPLLPLTQDSNLYGVSLSELKLRNTLHERIQKVLGDNRLVQQRRQVLDKGDEKIAAELWGAVVVGAVKDQVGEEPMEMEMAAADEVMLEMQVQSQAAFDQLNRAPLKGLKEKKRATGGLGRVEDLKLEYSYKQAAPAAPVAKRVPSIKRSRVAKSRLRRETSQLPEKIEELADSVVSSASDDATGLRITTFESEIDSFELSLLDSGHLVLFRKVWRDGRRYIQGALIEQKGFIDGVIGAVFRETALLQMSDLVVAYRGDVLSAFSGESGRGYLSTTKTLSGALLYQARLSAPWSDLQLLFSIRELPAGPGAVVLYWVAAILVMVLCAGFSLMYRLGLRQIALAEQQQDFVSAVSHELKTPLTSIRMYSEMLREGWVTEEKRLGYYDFIHDESERLSRLINNVLQLARMTRNSLHIELKPVTVNKLIDGIRSKVSSLVERKGFELELSWDDEIGTTLVAVDEDAFSQVIINLVDNALKFSAHADRRVVKISCYKLKSSDICFAVRDYGPGVPRDQMKKIFQLFFRSESELTRETSGTGIGLGLVKQLVLAMNGSVDVVNRQPGVEFTVSVPSQTH